jgi:hypothetical protein
LTKTVDTSPFLKVDGIGRCGSGKDRLLQIAHAYMVNSSIRKLVLSAVNGGQISVIIEEVRTLGLITSP